MYVYIYLFIYLYIGNMCVYICVCIYIYRYTFGDFLQDGRVFPTQVQQSGLDGANSAQPYAPYSLGIAIQGLGLGFRGLGFRNCNS